MKNRASAILVTLAVLLIAAPEAVLAKKSAKKEPADKAKAGVGPWVDLPEALFNEVALFHVPYADPAHQFVYAVTRDNQVIAFSTGLQERHRGAITNKRGDKKEISQLIVSSKGVVYVICEGYIYRSADYGQNFTRVHPVQQPEIPGHHSYTRWLAVDDKGNLYAFHAYDSGRISVLAHEGTEPTMSEKLEIGTNARFWLDRHGNLYHYSLAGNFRITDQGALEKLKMPSERAYLAGTAFEGTVYATSSSGQFRWTSSDKGNTWKELKLKEKGREVMITSLSRLSPHGTLLIEMDGNRELGTAVLGNPKVTTRETEVGAPKNRILDEVILAIK